MKKILFLSVIMFCSLWSFANPVFDKLNILNKCWAEQKDIAFDLPSTGPSTEQDWIRLHLSIVEKTLRARSTAHLTQEQKANRLHTLDILHDYMLAGAFPQNEKYPYRTPIFIDDHNNFCAVGYLVKETGYETVSRKIAAQTNLAYVKDMKYPELFAWAKEYGFTIDELAWIQPSYATNGWSRLNAMGKGTNGNVYELCVDTNTQRLYVGGMFSTVDSIISASNIAYVTEANGIYTWHSMGLGVNGKVTAIASWNNKVFVAGNFSIAGGTAVNNMASWDGSNWQSAGCINGTVKDMVVFDDTLYACGQFSVCNSSSSNFAKWNGNTWVPISGLAGTVNTMEPTDSVLNLGGVFIYGTDTPNVIKWNTVTGFKSYDVGIKGEVIDFTISQDTIFAVSIVPAGIQSQPMSQLSGNKWGPSFNYWIGIFSGFRTICAIGDSVFVGGNFQNSSMAVRNSFWHRSLAKSDYFTVDGPVNCMVSFKNKLVAAGDFNTCTYSSTYNVNSIGIREYISFWSLKPYIYTMNNCKNIDGGKAWVGLNGQYAGYMVNYGQVSCVWSTKDTSWQTNTTEAFDLDTGTYKVVITDWYGNVDSLPFHISQVEIDTTVTVSGNTLTALESSSADTRLRWLDCDNDFNIADYFAYQSFTPTKAGSYCLFIDKQGCWDTTQCYFAYGTDIKDVKGSALSVYPNPITDELNISFAETIDNVTVSIADISGRTLILTEVVNANKARVNTASLPPGVYTLQVKDSKGNSFYQKIIK